MKLTSTPPAFRIQLHPKSAHPTFSPFHSSPPDPPPPKLYPFSCPPNPPSSPPCCFTIPPASSLARFASPPVNTNDFPPNLLLLTFVFSAVGRTPAFSSF